MRLAGSVLTSYLAPVTSVALLPHTIPVHCVSQYTRYQVPLLPGVTALQQGSGGLPEFTYKPLQREDGGPALSVGQQQHRCLQHQHLEPLAQSVQPFPVHQHSLCVRAGRSHVIINGSAFKSQAAATCPCQRESDGEETMHAFFLKTNW